jgi:hypothetical protein
LLDLGGERRAEQCQTEEGQKRHSRVARPETG